MVKGGERGGGGGKEEDYIEICSGTARPEESNQSEAVKAGGLEELGAQEARIRKRKWGVSVVSQYMPNKH